MSGRILALRGLLKNKTHVKYRVESLNTTILNAETEQLPFNIRKAMAFKKALFEMPIFIQDDELIVGARTVYDLPAYILQREIDNGNKNIEVDGYDDVFGIHYNLGQDQRGFGIDNGDPPNYYKLLNMGLPGITNLAETKLLSADTQEKKDYYKSVLIAHEGIKGLMIRYAELAKKLSQTASPERAKELNSIAMNCESIVAKAPANFQQAVQLVFFTHIACWVEGSYLVPIGRFDQFMYPFYKKDVLETGLFSRTDIKELVKCFFIKLNYEIDKTHGCSGKFESDTGQTIVLGGVDPISMRESTNDLTYVVLECCAELKLTDPKIHVRFNKNSPEELWSKSMDLVALGMGFPTFHNDHAIIAALEKVGDKYYRKEDMYDYGISGCWEIIIPGKTSFRQCCNFDLLQPLEWVLNKGFGFRTIDRKTPGPFENGKRWGLYVGELEDFVTFDQLLNGYKKQLRYAVMMNAWHIIYGRIAHQPFLSSLIDDCLARGRDLNEGGARYNESDMQCCSLANAADSLYIIKKIVYDEKRLGLTELVDIIRSNYEGYECLRKEILNKYAHFGNDVQEMDSIARIVSDIFAEEYSRYTNALNGPFRPRISGATSSVYFAQVLGASADGRKQGDFLASNASPQAGVVKNGPTAVVNSLTCLDLTKFAGGAILNLKFSSTLLHDAKGLESLHYLIKTYFAQGGMQLQINILDRSMLKKAQENPSGFEDLIVRVWGFSTYFVSLPRSYQNQIINESEHSVS